MISRWVCGKCNKKWAYPIESCISCNVPVKKQRGVKTRIIGMTTVGIPSINHPCVPHQVVLLEDEFGSRMPKKTMKKVKIGDLFSYQAAKTEGAVALMKIKYDIEGDVFEALSLLKKINIQPSDKVLVKVSCIEQSTQQGAFTNPKIVDAVIKWLRNCGIKDIIVGEQALLGDSSDAAAKSGILSVCKLNSVPFIDISKEVFVEKELEGLKFKVAKAALERKIINVPVMRTHAQYGIAGALENLMRLLDVESQKIVHNGGIEKMLPKLETFIPAILCVGDATVVMQNAPSGEPFFLHLVLAGTSQISLDSVFSEVSMLNAPNYLKGVNVGELKIVGEEIDCVKVPLKLTGSGSPNPYVRFIGDADPMMFMGAVNVCRKLIGVGSDGATIQLAMGRFTKEMIDGKTRIVLYGKEAIENGKKLGITAVAEFTQEMPELQRIVLLRGILEDPKKKRIGVADMFKVKMAEFANR